MASSESLTRCAVGLDDIAGALALSRASGWNQSAADWAVFITDGRVLGLRSDDSTLVATAAALPYGKAQGWISMVLVTPAWRHRGLASELLADSASFLRASAIRPVLDATPAGEPVYRRMGFIPGMQFERWEAEREATDTIAARVELGSIRHAGPSDCDAICALDLSASLVERRFLLEAFLSRPDTRTLMSRDGRGFVIVRAGLRAAQIGPLVAGDERSAVALLAAALASLHGPVFLDVPVRWTNLTAWLQQAGFARQRPFTRMALGDAPALSGSDRLFIVAGPEFG